jgi:PAS domain-containing protein
VDTVREPLIVLDAGLRVVSANQSFYKDFQVRPEETEGQLLYELGNRQWDIAELRQLLEEILPEQSPFRDFRVTHNFETIGTRTMLLNARQVRREVGQEGLILLAITDITEDGEG